MISEPILAWDIENLLVATDVLSDSGMLRVKREDRTFFCSDAELRQNTTRIAAQYQTPGTATWRIGFEQ